jgi:uncharacterized damage-inducible protein DinB
MTNDPKAIAPFYQGWDVYQQHLIDVLTPLTSEQLALRVAPNLRSVSMIAAHIIGARARWLRFVLNEGDDALVPLGMWDRPDQPTPSAAMLVDGLATTWEVLEMALQRWTSDDLQEILRDVDDDGTEETFTRQWVIWHLIEHDLHHGGELSLALGIHGIPAIDL